MKSRPDTVRPQLLHIIDSLTLGGAEKLLVGIINELPGYQHHLVWLGGSQTLLKQVDPNCKLVTLNYRGKWDIPRCVVSLRKYIRQHHIQLVHSHLPMATLIARLACPRNIKLFTTMHTLLGIRFFAKGKGIQRAIEKLTYRKWHHLIGVSEAVCIDYNKFIGIKGSYSVMPNYVDDVFFKRAAAHRINDGQLRLVTVGNLKSAKNYSYLVECFKKLPKNVSLDIYGEGELRNELQRDIDAHQLNIRLCGSRNDIQELLGNYDLFVMSSSFEGYAIALMEAMASGMPALISDIPVLRETTENNGIYFDLRNTSDFVNKIHRILHGEIDLSLHAAHNLRIAKKVAGKEKYIEGLKRIYNCNEQPDGVYRYQPFFSNRQALPTTSL